MDSEVSKLLSENTNLYYDAKICRVKCKLTGHELPCKIAPIQEYLKGKKYKRAFERSQVELQEFLQIPEDINAHKNHLFCKLTWRYINNSPVDVKKHLNGYRFRKAFHKWQECKANGTEFVPNTSKYKPPSKKSDSEFPYQFMEDDESDSEETAHSDDEADAVQEEEMVDNSFVETSAVKRKADSNGILNGHVKKRKKSS